MSKRLGGIKRLQIQNHFMAFKQVPRCIPVCLDGTIIDSSTILVTMYYCGYVVV